MNKETIQMALNNADFRVDSGKEPNYYFYNN
jgi:hypothetical protein